ncbi:hypothetical protein [Geodermatophilus sp. DSM 44513]|uniref:hypothetical protein n=1 Tax=Geodermatophilus sp. DSM 44513 TaxID=1528104 RepID=UPI00128769D1|nr:hypothetical protein [Geodermatophilus sp. DSM 44513]WNV74288.1 hypothetical protein RTG05_14960 [Geodermatophilus sp. DSM 44513]
MTDDEILSSPSGEATDGHAERERRARSGASPTVSPVCCSWVTAQMRKPNSTETASSTGAHRRRTWLREGVAPAGPAPVVGRGGGQRRSAGRRGGEDGEHGDGQRQRQPLGIAGHVEGAQRGRGCGCANSALDLWNFAGDAATSIGDPWHDRGWLAERCYREPVAANMPCVFDLPSYRPRWLANEVHRVCQVLNDGVHLLRTALS